MEEIGNIKKYFDMIILKRGFEYYKTGHVKEALKVNNRYEAKISGTKLYKTYINIENNKVEDMHCSCPHYESGYKCNHLAALMYYLKDRNSVVKSLDVHEKSDENKYIANFLKELNVKNIMYKESLDYDLLDELIVLVQQYCDITQEHYKSDRRNIFEFLKYIYEFIYKEKYIKYDEDYYDDEYDEYFDDYYEENDIFLECIDIITQTLSILMKDLLIYNYAIEWFKFVQISEIERDILKLLYFNVNEERAGDLYNILEDKINKFAENNIMYITVKYVLDSKYLNKNNAVSNLTNKLLIYEGGLENIDKVIYILKVNKEYNCIVEIIRKLNLLDEQKYREVLIDSYYYVDSNRYYELIKEECYRYRTLKYYKILREKFSIEECGIYYSLIEKSSSISEKINLYSFENQNERIYALIKDMELEQFILYANYLGVEYKDEVIKKYRDDILVEYYKSYNLSRKVIGYIWNLSDIEGAEESIKDVLETIKKKGRITDGLKKEIEFIEKTLF